jgi:hypothetical protein
VTSLFSTLSRTARFVLTVCLIICTFGIFAASAFGAEEAPGWEMTASTYPTYLSPFGKGTLDIHIFNIGAKRAEGPITVTDVLPEGVTATRAGAFEGVAEPENPKINPEMWTCAGDGPSGAVEGASVVTCTLNPSTLISPFIASVFAGGGGMPTAGVESSGAPGTGSNIQPPIGIVVSAGGEARGLVNHVTIAGGGAPTPASTQDPITVSSQTPGFGFVDSSVWMSNADGTLDTQAGSHPYETTFAFDLATTLSHNSSGEAELHLAGGEARNIETALPPGFVVNPVAAPECTRIQFGNEECPQASMVGTATPYSLLGGGLTGFQVFNLVPPAGVSAELGFNFNGTLTFIDGGVRSGGDYGISGHSNEIPQKGIVGAVVTLWNVPGEASHNLWRNGGLVGCTQSQLEDKEELRNANTYCPPLLRPTVKPLLTTPTACGRPSPTVFRANSWQNEAAKSEIKAEMLDANGDPSVFRGCEHLQFEPSITMAPDTARSDTPAGLTVEVKPSVGGLEEQGGLGTSDIQNTTVTLPEGLVINPGQAAGLQACPRGRPSFELGNEHYGDGLTTQAERERGEEDDGPARCPGASKVGTVEIESPLIEGAAEKLFKGDVYVLPSNPPEVRLLVAASADGVYLKLVGVVHLNEQTGQLTTEFEGTPALPFTVFRLSFSGGAQAALDTPVHCGVYGPAQGFRADFQPWSSPFVADVFSSAEFALTEGPGGRSCSPSPLPFGPELIAGSTTDQAGGFTNFSLLLQRGDGQQRIERLQFRAPSGLAGLISQVPLCPEPQASAGTCSEASRIGHATVASGPGPYPLVIPQPGEPESPIFLTGPYEGAPFGLSIVTHVLAGPFNLGTIVTRARIEIDPHTAQITVTTDPLPQVVAGVPTDLRLINSVIDRPGFMFNPTSCASQEFSGTAFGTPPPSEGGPRAQAAISSHFGVGSCRELGFTPDFKASTSGKTSKAKGASLDVKVLYPNVPAGGGRVTNQANIASVKVELPKQLPSRLTTLQKACTAAQFASNPAGCPAASIVGHAVVHTPVLPVPLEGPAYFVSNGGEAFPNLIMVLQGYGVTVELVGDTFINKQGITSSTFKSTPDVPFSSFELNLPEGPFSALAANANLCAPTKTKTVKKRVTVRRRGRTRHLVRKVKELVPELLLMPTTIVGQNGAEIHQNTKIGVEGCARAGKAKHRAKPKRRKGKGRRTGG